MDKSRDTCNHCQKTGHCGMECFLWLASPDRRTYIKDRARKMKANGNLHVNQQSNNDSTKAATELADAPFSDHAWRATAIDRKAPQDWNCDSACTSHMSPNHNDFTTIMPFDYNHQVIFGDGRSVIAKGRGDVMIQLPGNKAGTKHRTNNVLFVPELATNLLSIFQLESRGFVVTFANWQGYLRPQRIYQSVCKAHRQRLYPAQYRHLRLGTTHH